MSSQTPETDNAQASDAIAIHGVDHLEIVVGNAAQAAYFLEHAYGLAHTAYCGLETGQRDSASYVLQQGQVRLVVTGTLGGQDALATHHARHGDAVRSIALTVPDATAAFEHAVAHGATSAGAPQETADQHGRVVTSSIRAYGDIVHTFVERDNYTGPFMPGFEETKAGSAAASLFTCVDHVVGNVELGRMNEWVAYYERVFGMTEMLHLTGDDISTEYSALMSKVLTDGSGRVKFPINEPADGLRKSQIEEFLDFHRGPGVQHVALTTEDIVSTVAELRSRGVKFLTVPPSYYESLGDRIGEIEQDHAALREQGILVDRDDEGYLLQIFTKPLGDRPTLFFEIIERRGARGFGAGNFKALFEAIEREQERRGNLLRSASATRAPP